MATTAIAGQAVQPSQNQLPFTIGSALTTRQGPSVNATLGAGVVQPVGVPMNIPSFGWLSNLLLDISLSYTAGATAPTLGPDGFDTLINSIGFRTSGGDPIIQPTDGFTLHMDNQFGGKRFGLSCPTLGTDPDIYPGTNLTLPAANAPATNRIFRALQFEIDPSTGLGSIPATASNREFTMDLSFAALSTIFATNPPASATVTFTITAVYWDVPADLAMPFGATPESQTLRLFQTERAPVNAGQSVLKSVNVGNVIMNHILIFRNGSNVRDDTDFSDPFYIDIDNNTRHWLTKDSWKLAMAQWFGLTAAVDTPGGLRSGVYVLPWRLLAGGSAADAYSSHAQYLTTQNQTQLQFKGTAYGAAGSLQISTDAVSTPNAGYLYSK